MTLTNQLAKYRRKPDDNRPKSKPDLVDVPTEGTGTVAIRPQHECAYCMQPVVIHNGQPMHATASTANCKGTPDPIKAWDA